MFFFFVLVCYSYFICNYFKVPVITSALGPTVLITSYFSCSNYANPSSVSLTQPITCFFRTDTVKSLTNQSYFNLGVPPCEKSNNLKFIVVINLPYLYVIVYLFAFHLKRILFGCCRRWRHEAISEQFSSVSKIIHDKVASFISLRKKTVETFLNYFN